VGLSASTDTKTPKDNKMTNPNIQIDDLIREMTDEEFTIYKEGQKVMAAAKAVAKTKAAARQSALAKLAELGLTAEEIAAL